MRFFVVVNVSDADCVALRLSLWVRSLFHNCGWDILSCVKCDAIVSCCVLRHLSCGGSIVSSFVCVEVASSLHAFAHFD